MRTERFLAIGPVSDQSLRLYNFGICTLHFAAMIFTIVELAMNHDWKIPVVTSFINWKQTNTTSEEGCGEGNCYVTNDFANFSNSTPDISMLGLVLAFHAVSFIWQFLTLFDNPVNSFYRRERLKNRNGLRWLEYAISAPLMMVVIACVLGEVDVSVYALLAICTSVLMAFGYISEIFLVHIPESETVGLIPTRLLPNIVGWVFFLCFWSVPTFTFVVGLNRSGQKPPQDVLGYIYAIYFVMLALFGCFGVVQSVHDFSTTNCKKSKNVGRYQLIDGKTTIREKTCLDLYRYNTIEAWYSVLSLTSKVLLGVLLTFMIRTRSQTLKLEFQ
jgi:hypothetical protein